MPSCTNGLLFEITTPGPEGSEAPGPLRNLTLMSNHHHLMGSCTWTLGGRAMSRSRTSSQNNTNTHHQLLLFPPSGPDSPFGGFRFYRDGPQPVYQVGREGENDDDDDR